VISSHVTEEAGEREELQRLSLTLRLAIEAAFRRGQPNVAVALDTARDAVDDVLVEVAPTPTRVVAARLRAELALQLWHEALSSLH